jgi:glyoxylase-like metal-dependent hydrolase (beta-lactamase superfamily II)
MKRLIDFEIAMADVDRAAGFYRSLSAGRSSGGNGRNMDTCTCKLVIPENRTSRTVQNVRSRRNFLASTGAAAASALLGPFSRGIIAQQPDNRGATLAGIVQHARTAAASSKFTVEKLRGNISVLIDNLGGNIAVLHGKDGKMLVDAGLAGSRQQISAALAGLGTDPVRCLVNTHWHFDHTDGNEWLHDAGATIIAHENVRKRMSEATHVTLWDFTFVASPAKALPIFTLLAEGAKNGSAAAMLYLNGMAVRLEIHPPAHTDGDISIEFTNADVVHLGDLWWNGLYPFIDYDTGGNINGVIRTVESILSRVTAKTLIIPGHGPVGNRSGLREFRDMLITVRDRVAALRKQGKSVEEVVAAKPTAEFDSRWGTSLVSGALFSRLVYAGV